MFSIGASKIANSAKDNVSRYGNIAGQKVTIIIQSSTSLKSDGHRIFFGFFGSDLFFDFVLCLIFLLLS